MNPSKFHRLGLCEAAQAIRRGDLRSEELTRALLERIANLENTVQAFEWIDPMRALDLARQADRQLQSGRPWDRSTAFRSESRILLKPRTSPPPWGPPSSRVTCPRVRRRW